MKNLNVVDMTPSHRFPETENVAREVHDALTEIAHTKVHHQEAS